MRAATFRRAEICKASVTTEACVARDYGAGSPLSEVDWTGALRSRRTMSGDKRQRYLAGVPTTGGSKCRCRLRALLFDAARGVVPNRRPRGANHPARAVRTESVGSCRPSTCWEAVGKYRKRSTLPTTIRRRALVGPS
jgi:hypothetical protein